MILFTSSLLKRVREFHYTITGKDKAPSAVQKAKTIKTPTRMNQNRRKKLLIPRNDLKGKLHMVSSAL
jgi:putative N6-adenine-specific DNA methylase